MGLRTSGCPQDSLAPPPAHGPRTQGGGRVLGLCGVRTVAIRAHSASNKSVCVSLARGQCSPPGQRQSGPSTQRTTGQPLWRPCSHPQLFPRSLASTGPCTRRITGREQCLPKEKEWKKQYQNTLRRIRCLCYNQDTEALTLALLLLLFWLN